MKLKRIFVALLLCTGMYTATAVVADTRPALTPVPSELVMQQGEFVWKDNTSLWIDAPQADKQILTDYLQASGLKLKAARKEASKQQVVLKVVPAIEGMTSPGVQSLLQLEGQYGTQLPALAIKDEPRFPYRGMMLDVSRHFFDKEFVKKQMDILSYYKINRLHLHLTDAAGWRIEIKKYPRLTQFAAWRPQAVWKDWWNGDRKYCEENDPQAKGGYYTQDDIRELVAYARQHYITLIPEIEMPAHSEEVLTAYPELSCTHEPYKQADFCIGNEKTYEFLENVLLEVMDLFPSKYIHVGGDEAGKASWKTCPLCQARMKEEGLKDVNELQSYLIHRMERFLNSHGRNLLGWDEILDGGLAPNATVMSWRGSIHSPKPSAVTFRSRRYTAITRCRTRCRPTRYS